MALIRKNFASGGTGMVQGGSGGDPNIYDILCDIALDLDDVVGGAPVAAIAANITQGALPAFTDPPSAAEMAAARALINEIRGVVIELRAAMVEARAARAAQSGVTLRTVIET
jgi:hypothetical protein